MYFNWQSLTKSEPYDLIAHIKHYNIKLESLNEVIRPVRVAKPTAVADRA